jgi:hypothetical protein
MALGIHQQLGTEHASKWLMTGLCWD